jgi:heat shock protein HtpX
MRISGQMERIPERDLRAVGQMNAFFIVPAKVKSAARSIFSTHPPMEARIARLQQLEAQLQGAR